MHWKRCAPHLHSVKYCQLDGAAVAMHVSFSPLIFTVGDMRSVCRDQLKPPLQPGQKERSSALALCRMLFTIHTQPHSSRQVISLTGVQLSATATPQHFLECGIHKVCVHSVKLRSSTTSCCFVASQPALQHGLRLLAATHAAHMIRTLI